MQPTFNFDFSSADNNCDFDKTFYIGFFLTTHLPQLAVIVILTKYFTLVFLLQHIWLPVHVVASEGMVVIPIDK